MKTKERQRERVCKRAREYAFALMRIDECECESESGYECGYEGGFESEYAYEYEYA